MGDNRTGHNIGSATLAKERFVMKTSYILEFKEWHGKMGMREFQGGLHRYLSIIR